MKTESVRTISVLLDIIRFGVWGIPGFLSAIILNYLLVDVLTFNIYLSYLVVLMVITIFNFYIVDNIVFKSVEDKNNRTDKRFIGFISVTIISRMAEWIMYSLIITYTETFYIFAQISVSILFLAFKFFLLRKVMQ